MHLVKAGIRSFGFLEEEKQLVLDRFFLMM